MRLLCGIDEAGRGPIAGPLVMAGVILNAPIKGLDDSKKLSKQRREALYEQIIRNARYHIVRFDATQIDETGIAHCLRLGVEQIMRALAPADFLFDGNSSFGAQGVRTQIKADAKVPQVSAASILAKVTRDQEMVRMDALYPHYGFKSHKGYGTALHVSMIQQYGYCPIHRKSFRLKALQPSLFD